MQPSAINRALCAAGTRGARLFAGVLLTASSEANSSGVSIFASEVMT